MNDSVNITVDNLDDYAVTVVDGENITVSLQGVLAIGGGGGGPLSTDQLLEGATNLYYTTDRVDTHLASGNVTTVDAVDITSNTLTLDGMVGAISWNAMEGTIDAQLDADTTIQLGQEKMLYARAGAPIADGQIVVFTGVVGNNLIVEPADQTAIGFDYTSLIGVATQALATNEFGYVVSYGKVRDLDTSAYVEGDTIFLGATGEWTTTPPATPYHNIRIGVVATVNPSTGVLFVDVVGQQTTDDTNEGLNNLYYTDTRVDTHLASGNVITIDSQDITTDTLTITGVNSPMLWNAEDGTVDLPVSPDVTIQLGQEQTLFVRNISGVSIPNGAAVRVTGASGAKLTVDLATNVTGGSADNTLAIATQTIPNNTSGYVTMIGIVRGLNTSMYAEGARLYLGVDGALTDVEPATPAHLVVIGHVVRSHLTEGSIYTHISNGWELFELHDVLITTPVDGDALTYDSANAIWVNSNIADTVTTLTHNPTTKILSYTDENSAVTNIDLTQYIDDTNLAYIISGNIDGAGIATFTRDDATSFTVDMSILLDDTNLARITTASWNTGDGVLTLTRNDATNITVDLDDRYLTAETDPIFTASPSANITAGNITNWDSAFSWGDHALQNYITTANSIGDLVDVDLTGLANGHVLTYNSTNTRFEPTTPSAGGVSDILHPMLLAGL